MKTTMTMVVMILKMMRIKVTRNWPPDVSPGLVYHSDAREFDELLVQLFTCQLIIQTVMKFGLFFLLLTGVLKWGERG